MTVSANRFLTKEEQTENAQYVLEYLINKRWTKEAICGMLGNIQTESNINPGIWEGLKEGNLTGGFGLVQWTPATKYFTWCDNNGYSYGDMDSNLERILYEVRHGLQFYHPTMSFQEFTQSTDTPENLAQIFLTHYERPANQNQPWRQEQARWWYDNLEVEVNKMEMEDAVLLIGILQEEYRQGVTLVTMEDGTVKAITQDDIHRLANVVRKLVGIEEQ